MPEPNLHALSALRRLRRVETDEARRDLSEALAREVALATKDEAIQQELNDARRMTGDFDREAFFAWTQRVHAERARLAEALRDAGSKTAAAREALSHRRLAKTVAEEALARAVAAREAEIARRDQVMLEDISRALRRAALSRGAG